MQGRGKVWARLPIGAKRWARSGQGWGKVGARSGQKGKVEARLGQARSGLDWGKTLGQGRAQIAGQPRGKILGEVRAKSKVGAGKVGARSGQNAWARSGHKLLDSPGAKCWARSGQGPGKKQGRGNE